MTQLPAAQAIVQPTAVAHCLHCELPMGRTAVGRFCCSGCQAVHELLRSEELQRYYRLRQGPGSRVVDVPNKQRDLSWVDDLIQGEMSTQRLRLDLQGIHCSGCVWLLEKTFKQEPGAGTIVVNPALGTVDLSFDKSFPVHNWVHSVERFGYRFGPALKTRSSSSDGLLLRLGICVAVALNVMFLSLALYVGLSEGRLYEMVRSLSYALASVSVLVGGPVFFRSALAGLRNRVLHLDVPISLGILLAFAGSSWAFWSGNDGAMYLDSVSVFIALMLLGRYLQERVLQANRNRLLASDGTEGLRSKRVTDGRPTSIKSRDIRRGDTLLIASGDLIPVACRLLTAEARLSTDWINGETEAHRRSQGDLLQAGSFNAGDTSVQVEASEDFEASRLDALLRPPKLVSKAMHETGLVQQIARYYTIGVLVAAAFGFMGWLLVGGDTTRSLEVATAVLVVTCPCAFGIATPLAHELIYSRLRREGLYVRSGDFLSRAATVTKVVFDKTGTVTSGVMRLADSSLIADMASNHRQALFDLCARSTHPTSAILFTSMQSYALQITEGLRVVETPGQGLCAEIGSSSYRLGKVEGLEGTIFRVDDETLAVFAMQEEPSPDAPEEFAALDKEGFELFLLSGDQESRVKQFASEVGLPGDHAQGQQSPEEKREWLKAHDQGDLLFVGDGINDSLAAQQATCSGTPALDRPFMASHCDFFLGTKSIAPIRAALHGARALRKVIHRNLVFAVSYNLVAIGLAWAGLMSPWLAALLMPASSILIVLATTASLSPKATRSLSWKS